MSLFLSFWGQIKELLKKLEKLSEEVLAVRSENAHLAVQLQVCFMLYPREVDTPR